MTAKKRKLYIKSAIGLYHKLRSKKNVKELQNMSYSFFSQRKVRFKLIKCRKLLFVHRI